MKLHSDSNKKLTSSTCVFWLTTYSLCLVWFFNIQSAFQWVPIVFLFLPTYSFIRMNFIQVLLQNTDKKLAISFNFTFRYIDDVLSLNNPKFGDYVDRIYPFELEKKILQIQLGLPDILTCISKLIMRSCWEQNSTIRQESWFQFSHC